MPPEIQGENIIHTPNAFHSKKEHLCFFNGYPENLMISYQIHVN